MKLGTLCYVNNGEQTLMMHRVKKENDMHKGKWNGLGGKFKDGESPEECVIREVKEESGLKLIKPSLKGIITFPAFDDIDDWMVFVFTSDQFTGSLIECDEGILKWIENDKLNDLELWEGDKIFMRWLNDNPFFSAKFLYERKKYVNHEVIFYK